MKFFTLFLVAAAGFAGAVEISHEEALKRVQATEFGATVLADLQERLNVADPVAALREFIEKIRKRIADEGIADAKEQKVSAHESMKNLALTEGEIDAAIEEINTCTGEISKQQGIIENKIAAMISKKIQIRDTKAAIAYNQDSIVVGDSLRAANEEAYTLAKEDAANVRAAVQEILDIEKGSKLHANQDNAIKQDKNMDLKRVEDVSSPTLLSVNALTKLQQTAALVSNPTAQSFIQLAALSTQAFGGDIDELRNLLNRLIQEVDDFAASLGAENSENAADWSTLKGTMQAEIADWQADLIRLDMELKALRSELGAARNALTVGIKCYNTQRSRLQTEYATKAQLLTTASDNYSAFLEKEALRAEELETLQLIYEIIKDKLEDASSNIKDNVKELMAGGNDFASKCQCDHACKVFEDCCPECDVDSLPSVPSKYDNNPVVYEGGDKELPARNSASMYSTYYQGGNGFHF